MGHSGVWMRRGRERPAHPGKSLRPRVYLHLIVSDFDIIILVMNSHYNLIIYTCQMFDLIIEMGGGPILYQLQFYNSGSDPTMVPEGKIEARAASNPSETIS